jgi:radical SAM protein with 4Fe4S-binding SPASM domain
MEHQSRFGTAGIHHATINGHRFHLRLKDPTRDNFLWIDGRQPPLVLDETAAEFVRLIIDGMWLHQQGDGDNSEAVINHVVEQMARRYVRRFTWGKWRVTRETIKDDLNRIFGQLMEMASGTCPVDMGLEGKGIHYGSWTAPARMDLAITYRCNLKCQKCYVGDKKDFRELTTEEWAQVYEALWKIGVPQIVFTGGEPTMRDDIVTLIDHAGEFVTGLVTNGTKLSELAGALKEASLDYTQITIESSDKTTHDSSTGVPGSFDQTVAGIKKALEVGLEVVTNTTLTKTNGVQFAETMTWLHSLGVKHVACNTLICSGGGTKHKLENGLTDDELKAVLTQACNQAGKLSLDFQWYSPTCYQQGVNPMELGFGVKACSAAAHNMTIQPDGTVLPCQSWPETVGNILTDNWKDIWQHPVCRKLRDHLMMPEACRICGFKDSCGGGCPLDQAVRTPHTTDGKEAI